MTRARTLADMISDGVIGTTELADDAITPVKLDETGSYAMAGLTVDTNTLHVDSANNRVGIGTTSPASQAHIYNASANANLRIETDADAYASISFLNDQSNWGAGVDTANHFYVYDSISASNVMEFGNNDIVFNQTGKDYDFRVESDNLTHAFFVNAGNDNVGIGGTPNTTAHLDVTGSISGGYGGMIRLNNTGTSGCMGFIGVTDTNWGIGSGKLIIGRGSQGSNTSSSLTELTFSDTEVVFNENSNDRDFRVESNASEYALFVDGANNSVGIKTNATDAALNVNSQSNSTDAIRIVGSGGNNFIQMVGNQGQTAIRMWENGANDPGYTSWYNQGSPQHKIQSGANETVTFNEQGINTDFVVESQSQSHMLFVDAGSNYVSFGTNATDIGSSSSGEGAQYRNGESFRVQRDNGPPIIANIVQADGDIIALRKNGASVGNIGTANGGDLYIGNDDTALLFAGGSDAIIPRGTQGAARDGVIKLGLASNRFAQVFTDEVTFNDGHNQRIVTGSAPNAVNTATTALEIHADAIVSIREADDTNHEVFQLNTNTGFLSLPFHPHFIAKRNSTINWTNGTLSWGTETRDITNNFNGTRFTAPADGTYQFSVILTITGGTTGQDDSMEWGLYRNGSAYAIVGDNWSYRLGTGGNGVELSCSMTQLMRLNANDYVDVRVSGISHTGGQIHSHSHFTGFLVC